MLAHQYLEQVAPDVREAIFGNVGSMVAFRVGTQDVTTLEREFAPISGRALMELARFEICAKVLRGGEVSDPFMAATLPPLATGYGGAETVIGRSRRRFARPREEVEGKILRWLDQRKPRP